MDVKRNEENPAALAPGKAELEAFGGIEAMSAPASRHAEGERFPSSVRRRSAGPRNDTGKQQSELRGRKRIGSERKPPAAKGI